MELGDLRFFKERILGDARCAVVYRGSRDGFRAEDFHKKCDGRSHTVTIIKNDAGKIFGGYTSVKWTSNA